MHLFESQLATQKQLTVEQETSNLQVTFKLFQIPNLFANRPVAEELLIAEQKKLLQTYYI